MLSSRGMGKIDPSKMPGKKTITRKDDPNDVAMYSGGGSVKFDLDSLNYDKGNVGMSGKMSVEKKLSDMMPDAPRAVRDAVLSAYLSGDLNMNRQGAKAVPSAAGIGINLPFAEGGHVGLYDNINAKRKRIAQGSGEKMRKPGAKGSPSKQDFIDSAKTAKK
jgi:hypothetical protein